MKKCQWVIGKSIGSGGFGFIYLADKHASNSKATSSSPYVVKINYT